MSPLSTNPRQPVTPATRGSPRCARWSPSGHHSAPWPTAASGRGCAATRAAARRAPTAPPRSRGDAIEALRGRPRVTFGGWHGDWGRWNMGMGDGVLQLWDWERYDPEVPVGFDGLHSPRRASGPASATRSARRRRSCARSRTSWPSSVSRPAARPHPPPVPARDRRPVRRRTDPRRDPGAAAAYRLGAVPAGAAVGSRIQPRRKDDHDPARIGTPPPQDRGTRPCRSGWAPPPPAPGSCRRSCSWAPSAPARPRCSGP